MAQAGARGWDRDGVRPAAPPADGRPELRALTGLRFVAALYVFLFHVHIRWPLTATPWLDNLLSQGAVGMTVFFMLSGFILAYQYGGRPLDGGRFLRNRFARIYPLYALAALLALPVLARQLALTEAPFGALSTLAQLAVLLLAGTLMLQAWLPALFPYWNNDASWSLSAEAFFYLLFIPLVGPLGRLSRRRTAVLAGGLYVLSGLPAVAYCAFPDRPDEAVRIFYAMPVFRAAEFVLGAALFFLWDASGRTASPALRRAAGATLLATVLYLARLGHVLPLFTGHNVLVVPATGLALWVLATDRGAAARLLGSAPGVWLGKVSYAFYSFQFHVLAVVVALGGTSLLPAPALLAVSFATLLAVAAAGYHGVEEPARRALCARRHRTTPLHAVGAPARAGTVA